MIIFDKILRKNFTNSKLINKKLGEYLENPNIIASDSLRDKFKISGYSMTKEERDYARNFAKTSLFVDNLIKKSKTEISDGHKELMTEVIFSFYEYLNENHSDIYSDFNKFFNVLNKRFVSFKFEDIVNGKIQTYGFNNFGRISLKQNLDKLSKDYDYLFADIFAHELCHSISRGRKSIGLINTGSLPVFKDVNFFRDELSHFDEIQTEYMVSKILRENFGENLFKFNLNIKDNETVFPLDLESRIFNYKESAYIGATLNAMFDLEHRYLKDGESINALIEENFYGEQIKNIFNKYLDMLDSIENYGTSDQAFNKKTFDILNTSIENFVLNYCEMENAPDSKYLEITSKMLNNKIYLEPDISENEISVIKMDFQYFKGEKFSREDVLNIVRDESYIENEFVKEKFKERDNLDKELGQNLIKIILPKTEEKNASVDSFEL